MSYPNRAYQRRDFYVSYNDVDTDPALYGSDTTAIVPNDMSRFYVLNGDHREELKDVQTLREALVYFDSVPDLRNFRSDKRETT